MVKGRKQKTSGNWVALLLCGAASFVTGLLIFFFIGLPEIARERQLHRDGVIAEAVVIRKDLQKAGSASSTECWLTYRFETGQASGFEARTTVTPGVWEDVAEGRHLEVRYLPSDPHLHRLVLEGRSSSMLSSLVLSGGFALAGGVFFFIGYGTRQRWRKNERGERASLPEADVSTGSPIRSRGRFNSFVDSFGFGIVFGGVFLLAGVIFLLVSINLVYNEHELRTNGQVIQGKVLAKYLSTGSRYRNRTDLDLSGITRSVLYRFTTSDGQQFDGLVKVEAERWATLHEQEPVQVVFLPWNPSVNRLPGRTSWGLTIVFGVLGGIFTLAGLAVTIVFSGKLATSRILAHRGIIAQGTVVAVENEGVGQSVIHYQYFDARGNICKGRSEYLSEKEADLWKVGDNGTVRFDPRHPTRSAWAGRSP